MAAKKRFTPSRKFVDDVRNYLRECGCSPTSAMVTDAVGRHGSSVNKVLQELKDAREVEAVKGYSPRGTPLTLYRFVNALLIVPPGVDFSVYAPNKAPKPRGGAGKIVLDARVISAKAPQRIGLPRDPWIAAIFGEVKEAA